MKNALATDLVNDVLSGKIRLHDAERIQQNRDNNSHMVCEEVEQVVIVETNSCKQVGSYRLKPTKGWGKKTINACGHGKAMVPVGGSGAGRYKVERLHRVDNSVAM